MLIAITQAWFLASTRGSELGDDEELSRAEDEKAELATDPVSDDCRCRIRGRFDGGR